MSQKKRTADVVAMSDSHILAVNLKKIIEPADEHLPLLFGRLRFLIRRRHRPLLDVKHRAHPQLAVFLCKMIT